MNFTIQTTDPIPLDLARRIHQKSQIEMARALDCSQGTYSHLERGYKQFSEELKMRTAGVLGMSVDQIAWPEV